MPKVQLEYQGKIHSFQFEFNQRTKENVQEQIKNLWGLKFEEVVLDYIDSDGDKICVDTQEDFDVAQETLDNNSSNLTFRATLNTGSTPTFTSIQYPKLEQIKKVQQPTNTQETLAAPQSESTVVQSQPQVKQEQIKIQAHASQNVRQETMVDQKKQKQNNENQKKQNKELELKKKLQQEEKKKIQAKQKAQAKERARIEAQLKKKELQLIQEEKRKAKEQARLKKEQQKREEQQRKLAEKKKNQQQKKLQKVEKTKQQEHKSEESKDEERQNSSSSDKSVGKVKKQKKQETLTQERVKLLVRQQILLMVPELRQKILQPEKQEKKVKKVPNVESKKEFQNLCSVCNGQLAIPFYFNTETKKYQCNQCEATSTQLTPILKIRDPQHLKNSYYTYGGVLNVYQMTESPQNWEKYIEEARVKVVTEIKQDFKVKIQEKKKQMKQKEAAKKQKEAAKKEKEAAQNDKEVQ